jgi:Fe2+ or Zn2+ uptake regulation protein
MMRVKIGQPQRRWNAASRQAQNEASQQEGNKVEKKKIFVYGFCQGKTICL